MQPTPTSGRAGAAALIRRRIEQGGERLWRYEDFRDLSPPAAAQALSRLARQGAIERLSKGIYYRGRRTAFGMSRPNPADLRRLAAERSQVFPSGLAAAGHLGFTTQNPRRPELATTAVSLPRKLVGADAIIRTRRPEAWSRLDATEAALLDFLRRGGRTGELSPRETIRRMQTLLSEPGRFARLLAAADTEPPRVRALLGAFGERLGRPGAELRQLKASLNPLSRFDFGVFAALTNTSAWQAKGPR